MRNDDDDDEDEEEEEDGAICEAGMTESNDLNDSRAFEGERDVDLNLRRERMCEEERKRGKVRALIRCRQRKAGDPFCLSLSPSLSHPQFGREKWRS